MRIIKAGTRIVYEHEKGGFNGIATSSPTGENDSISLIFVNPNTGNVITEDDVPNVQFAKDNDGRSLPFGHWRQ